MKDLENKFKHINGWGIDADPNNDPTYPMKNWNGDDHERLNWERPTLQQTKVEILHSIERPGLSATFGTPNPPAGLSGAIRRFAFQFSENRFIHWLPLLLADRVNVVEGLIEDFQNGSVPNILAEKGIKADIKYSKTTLVKRLAITTAITAGVAFLMYKTASSGKKSD